jgi:hypothetical protein
MPTISVSTLGSRGICNRRSGILPTLPLLHLRFWVPLHRLQKIQGMGTSKPRARKNKQGGHIRSGKLRSLKRSAGRSGRVIELVLLLVWHIIASLFSHYADSELTHFTKNAVTEKGLDTLLDQARRDNPLRDPEPPVPSPTTSTPP